MRGLRLLCQYSEVKNDGKACLLSGVDSVKVHVNSRKNYICHISVVVSVDGSEPEPRRA